jgi:hypothetical protein
LGKIKGVLLLGIFIISSLSLIFYSPIVDANPIPIVIQGGNPVIDNETSIYLKEEVVNISTGDVEAIYTFKNQNNESVTQLIYLPFLSNYGILEYSYLTITSNGKYISFNQTSFNDSDHRQYDAISFELTLGPFKEKEIIAQYDTDFEQSSTNTYTTYSYTYLTTTGKYWNHSIDNAEFNFIISNSMCDTHYFPDYEVIENEDYIIATRKYIDWKPWGDISISWTNYHSKLLIADFSIEGDKYYVGEEIVFDPKSTYYEYDIDLYTVEFEWRFGDGNSSFHYGYDNLIVNHTYLQPGKYEVNLTARSSYSYSIVDYKSKIIEVEPRLNITDDEEKTKEKEEAPAFIPGLGVIPIVGTILIMLLIKRRIR